MPCSNIFQLLLHSQIKFKRQVFDAKVSSSHHASSFGQVLLHFPLSANRPSRTISFTDPKEKLRGKTKAIKDLTFFGFPSPGLDAKGDL